MKIAALLKPLMVLLLAGELLAAPLVAAPAVQQDDDDDDGVTFDNLLPAAGYTLYIEARNIGALLRAAEFRETFEPIAPLLEQMNGATEFKLVRLVTDNADLLQHSRVMFALGPADHALPATLIAFELESEDAADGFAAKLQESFAPPRQGGDSQTSGANGTKNLSSTPAIIHQAGRLVALSLTPFTFKELRGQSDQRMSDDLSFRAARDHFAAEPLFIYYDIALSEGHKASTEEMRSPAAAPPPPPIAANTNSAREELTVAPVVNTPPPAKTRATPGGAPTSSRRTATPGAANRQAVAEITLPPAAAGEQDLLASLLNLVLSGDGNAQHHDAVAVALALEDDALIARALLMGTPGAAVAPLPFLSLPVCGAALSSEAANYMPADTGIFVAASLDWPRLYDLLTQSPRTSNTTAAKHAAAQAAAFESRRAAFEKANQVRLVDVLAATLGNEIALSVPVSYLGHTPLGRVPLNARAATTQPLALIAVRDREALLPKLRPLLEAVGVRLANAKATTEQAGDIEITSYGNRAYAFADNYLLMAVNAATIRRAIEARASNATLAASHDFQSYTQWQPRAAVAQVYVAAAVLKGLFPDHTPNSEVMKDEAAKEFLARYRFEPEPVTYAASAEGVGARYELRIPRRLLMRAFSELAASEVASRVQRNEAFAKSLLDSLKEQESAYKTQHGRYATLDEIIADESMGTKDGVAALAQFKDMLERYGYKFEMTASASGYEATMTPIEYGKTAKRSFYTDQSGVVRGADHQGKAASSADPPIDPKREY
ncbi:MAG TPA: hypothetical protein VKA60_11595 [Blastocatellia bacterium]|nr:hypothetical protein [Blastocatellia bacterium]